MIARVLFWLCVAGLAYVYVGYPVLIVLLAKLFPRPVRKGAFSARVSVLIAAHNEENVIAAKLRNLLSLDGADMICEVLVGSDGSTDKTGETARSVLDHRVRVMEFPQRRGKGAVLNDLMERASGEIVVFTDARQELAKNALTALVTNFADPSVGVVSGELIFRPADASSETAAGMGAYWGYEKTIRKAEAAFHSVPGATGALYAIRRNLLKPIPPQTLLDDVAIPMQAVTAGYRCIFEPEAVVWDVPTQTARQEAIRKRRTLAGNFQLLTLYPQWLLPGANPIAWQFLSHKIARLLSPLFLLGGLVGAGLASSAPFYSLAFVIQVGLPVAAWALNEIVRRTGACSWLRAPWIFYSLNATIVMAFWDALRRRYRPAWQRANSG